MVQTHMQEFTLDPLRESWSVPGGRQLVGQAANLIFESACRVLYAEYSPIAMYYYSTIGLIHIYCPSTWVDLGTKVSVQPVPKLCVAVIFVKNTENVCNVCLILGPLVPQASMLLLDHCDMLQMIP